MEEYVSDDILQWLQHWYHSNCDGEWERDYGVTIATTSNPGWSISIDLAETWMSEAEFSFLKIERDEHDWIICQVHDGQFKGAGGPLNLVELLEIFRTWVMSHDEHPKEVEDAEEIEYLFRRTGEPQYNPVTRQCVHPPHVQTWSVPGRIRPAETWEIP